MARVAELKINEHLVPEGREGTESVGRRGGCAGWVRGQAALTKVEVSTDRAGRGGTPPGSASAPPLGAHCRGRAPAATGQGAMAVGVLPPWAWCRGAGAAPLQRGGGGEECVCVRVCPPTVSCRCAGRARRASVPRVNDAGPQGLRR